MRVFAARNVERALRGAFVELAPECQPRSTRNGLAFVHPEPVTTVFVDPRERVLFDPVRDANPFFHLVEAVWMLLGRDDVETVARYVGRMRTYSDDGHTLHGAYGRRWRFWGGGDGEPFVDQLDNAIEALRKDPTDRRAGVIAMWDPGRDPAAARRGGRDVPCNLTLNLAQNADQELDLTVFCRSNDAVWGAYGANAVHFSMLQEFVAEAAGLPVGRYRQVSANWHIYDNDQNRRLSRHFRGGGGFYRYRGVMGFPGVEPFDGPIALDVKRWRTEAARLLEARSPESPVFGAPLEEPFLRRVVRPMMMAHELYVAGNRTAGAARGALALLRSRRDREDAFCDWLIAGDEWLERRVAKGEEEAERILSEWAARERTAKNRIRTTFLAELGLERVSTPPRDARATNVEEVTEAEPGLSAQEETGMENPEKSGAEEATDAERLDVEIVELDPEGELSSRAKVDLPAGDFERNREAWVRIVRDDVAGLEEKEREYAGSWKRRGGVGAFMMLARKWDRIEAQAMRKGWDLFAAIRDDFRPEGVLDDVRDLRRYLLLVEGNRLAETLLDFPIASPAELPDEEVRNLAFLRGEVERLNELVQNQARELDSRAGTIEAGEERISTLEGLLSEAGETCALADRRAAEWTNLALDVSKFLQTQELLKGSAQSAGRLAAMRDLIKQLEAFSVPPEARGR